MFVLLKSQMKLASCFPLLPDLFIEYRKADSFLVFVMYLATPVKVLIRTKCFLAQSLGRLRIFILPTNEGNFSPPFSLICTLFHFSCLTPLAKTLSI